MKSRDCFFGTNSGPFGDFPLRKRCGLLRQRLVRILKRLERDQTPSETSIDDRPTELTNIRSNIEH